MSKELNLEKKYFALDFHSILGNEDSINSLTNCFLIKNIPNMFLIYGPEKSGKSLVADLLKKELNCEDNIYIKNLSESKEYLNFASQKQQKISLILEDCELLENDDWNLIQKLFKDESPNFYLILITKNINKVPESILPIAFNVKLENVPIEILKPYLLDICRSENIKVEKNVLEKLCDFSFFSPGECLTNLEKVAINSDNKVTNQAFLDFFHILNDQKKDFLLKSILDLNLSCENFINQISNSKISIKYLTKNLIQICDFLIKARVSNDFNQKNFLSIYKNFSNENIESLKKELLQSYFNMNLNNLKEHHDMLWKYVKKFIEESSINQKNIFNSSKDIEKSKTFSIFGNSIKYL